MKVMKVVNRQICTPIIQYRKGDLTVTAIGAVHIGEPDYYSTLQSIIDQTPSGFYERLQPINDIANVPEDKRVYIEDMSNSRETYMMLAKCIGFTTQHGITYPDSWTCPDMRLDELMTLMPHKGLMRMTKDKKEDIEALVKACPTEIQSAVKGTFKYIAKVPGLGRFVFNRASGSAYKKVILKARNERLFEKLGPKLDNPDTDDIGVIYGSAHLFGINKFLRRKKFKNEGVAWIPAWNLNYDMHFLEAWGRISVFEKKRKKEKAAKEKSDSVND